MDKVVPRLSGLLLIAMLAACAACSGGEQSHVSQGSASPAVMARSGDPAAAVGYQAEPTTTLTGAEPSGSASSVVATASSSPAPPVTADPALSAPSAAQGEHAATNASAAAAPGPGPGPDDIADRDSADRDDAADPGDVTGPSATSTTTTPAATAPTPTVPAGPPLDMAEQLLTIGEALGGIYGGAWFTEPNVAATIAVTDPVAGAKVLQARGLTEPWYHMITVRYSEADLQNAYDMASNLIAAARDVSSTATTIPADAGRFLVLVDRDSRANRMTLACFVENAGSCEFAQQIAGLSPIYQLVRVPPVSTFPGV